MRILVCVLRGPIRFELNNAQVGTLKLVRHFVYDMSQV